MMMSHVARRVRLRAVSSVYVNVCLVIAVSLLVFTNVCCVLLTREM